MLKATRQHGAVGAFQLFSLSAFQTDSVRTEPLSGCGHYTWAQSRMTVIPAKLVPAKAGSGNPRPRRAAPWATAGSVLPSAFTRTLDQHVSVNIEIVSRLTIENDT